MAFGRRHPTIPETSTRSWAREGAISLRLGGGRGSEPLAVRDTACGGTPRGRRGLARGSPSPAARRGEQARAGPKGGVATFFWVGRKQGSHRGGRTFRIVIASSHRKKTTTIVEAVIEIWPSAAFYRIGVHNHRRRLSGGGVGGGTSPWPPPGPRRSPTAATDARRAPGGDREGRTLCTAPGVQGSRAVEGDGGEGGGGNDATPHLFPGRRERGQSAPETNRRQIQSHRLIRSTWAAGMFVTDFDGTLEDGSAR